LTYLSPQIGWQEIESVARMSCSLCRRSIVAENEYVGGKGGLTSHVSGCGLYEGASYVHTPCIIELHTDHSQAHVIHHVCKFVFPGVNSLFRPAPRRTHAWCRAAGGVAPPRAGPPAVGGHGGCVATDLGAGRPCNRESGIHACPNAPTGPHLAHMCHVAHVGHVRCRLSWIISPSSGWCSYTVVKSSQVYT
jgi:hypothetical protein